MVRSGVYAVLLTQSLEALVTMVMLPTIPFFAMKLGANAFDISLLGSSFYVAQIFCSPALGIVSDQVGRRPVLLCGLFGQAVCNALLSRVGTMPLLLGMRFFQGVAFSCQPVEMAYIMEDVDSEEELSRVLVMQRIIVSLGALLGPILARFFSGLSFGTICHLMVGINVINIAFAYLLVTEPKGNKKKKQSSLSADEEVSPASCSSAPLTKKKVDIPYTTTVIQIITGHKTGILLCLVFVKNLGDGLFAGPEPIFFSELFQFGQKEFCNFIITACVSTTLFSMFTPTLIEIFGPITVCVLGCIGHSTSTLFLLRGTDAAWIPYFNAAITVGLCNSMLGIAFTHVVQKMTSRSQLGAMLGLVTSVQSAAGTIGQPIGGAVYPSDPYIPALLSAVASAISGFLFSLLPHVWADEKLAKETQLPFMLRELSEEFAYTAACMTPFIGDKTMTNHIVVRQMMFDLDPESSALYWQYREALDREESKTSIPKHRTEPSLANRGRGHREALDRERSPI